MCNHRLELPGPPLKAKVTGRSCGSTSSSVYDVIATSATALRPCHTPSFSSSVRSTTVPDSLVYRIGPDAVVNVCDRRTSVSVGVGADSAVSDGGVVCSLLTTRC